MSFNRTIIVSALMLFTMLVLAKASQVENIHSNRPFSTFPKQIGNWSGTEQRFDQKIYDALGVDDSFLATYDDSNGRQVSLYIGFYQSQKKGELIHSPKLCMPGSGWNIIHTSILELNVPKANPGRLKIIKLIVQKGAEKQVAFYWYQSRGRLITSEYMQKIYLVIDSIFRNRTDGSFIRLMAPVKNSDFDATTQYLMDFTSLVYPILSEFIPS
jgi:EpsI family protein